MKKKYELTDETIEIMGKNLHRIRALRDFGNVKAGDLGGFIEKEGNLSHVGNCWVGDSAKVFEYAAVCGDAKVYENAAVSDDAEVFGKAKIYGNARVYGRARVSGNNTV